jgi:hypothetical protein
MQLSHPVSRLVSFASVLLSLAGVGMLTGIAEAQSSQDRPFVIKPDGVVQRPKAGIKSPDLDDAWEAYTQTTDECVRSLADECFEDERTKLLQEGRLPVTPRMAVEKYWGEVDDAREQLLDAYRKHGAMEEWKNDVASQIPRRFPQDGEYLLVEGPNAGQGRAIRVKDGRVCWLLRSWKEDDHEHGQLKETPGASIPLPVKDAQPRMTLRSLVNPENRQKIDVTTDLVVQTYELRLFESDGRHVRDVAGSIAPLSNP